jgi:hypothetical protein
VIPVVLRGIERTLPFRHAAALVATTVVPQECLHGGDERARYHEEVAIENANHVEEGIEAGYDLAGLDSGYVHLRETEASSEFRLRPGALVPGFDQFAP